MRLAAINAYSFSHFAIWFVAGRFTQMTWPIFLTLSIGWEIMEWFLPFEFAIEELTNKAADLAFNMGGFILGRHLKYD